MIAKGRRNISTTSNRMKDTGRDEQVGGMPFLVGLISVSETKTPIRQHCLLVKQKSLQRKLAEFSSKTLKASMDDGEDVFEALREAEGYLSGINGELAQMRVTPIENVAMNVIDTFCTKVEKAKSGEVDDSLVYTGIREWDEINGALFNAHIS